MDSRNEPGGMGLTYVRIHVSKDAEGRTRPVRAVVDTGATYTMLPRRILESLGARPSESIRVRLADGRPAHRELGLAFVRYGRHATPTWVLFGEPRDATVLGALTLEELRLQVDPSARRLREIREALMVPLATA